VSPNEPAEGRATWGRTTADPFLSDRSTADFVTAAFNLWAMLDDLELCWLSFDCPTSPF
jgi:hypothetical protein